MEEHIIIDVHDVMKNGSQTLWSDPVIAITSKRCQDQYKRIAMAAIKIKIKKVLDQLLGPIRGKRR